MNISILQVLAHVCTFSGTVIGVPSLSVLLLYAINELRTPIRAVAPPTGDLAANPDALRTALQTLAAWNYNFVTLATLGFLIACGCWVIGKELSCISTFERNPSQPDPHLCLSMSIRG
jgi:hypothetical protein